MTPKTTILGLAIAALALAGCTAPQEAGNHDAADNATDTCPSDLDNETTTGETNSTDANATTDGSDTTYGASQDGDADAACADMAAPAPGNETNTTPSYP